MKKNTFNNSLSSVVKDENSIHMIPLGGCNPDQIGMNCTLYVYKGRFIIVDLGITFEKTPGVDALMPHTGFIEDKMDLCEGIIVTHAHEDHLGAIPYLWLRLNKPKIFATPFTSSVLKNKFIGLMGNKFDKSIITIIKDRQKYLDLGPFSIRFIPITHSIPDSNALMIKTGGGNILHTGDWKIDETPVVGEKTDYCAFEEARKDGILAVVGDSTNVFREEPSGSEESVYEALNKAVINCKKGKICIVCFASNIHRIASILRVALENDKYVVFVGRSVNLFYHVAVEHNLISESVYGKIIITPEEAKNIASEKLILICTGSQGEERAAIARMAFGKHPWFNLEKGDTVIFSSRLIPGNEKQVHLIANVLCKIGVEVFDGDSDRTLHVSGHPSEKELTFLYKKLFGKNPSDEKLDTIFEDSELKGVKNHSKKTNGPSEKLDGILVPVHGEDRHIKKHSEIAIKLGLKSTRPSNGVVLKITKDGAEEVGRIKIGRLFKDGKELMERDSPIMRDRVKMMGNGSVYISMVLDQFGDVLGVEVSSSGLKGKWHRINKEIKESVFSLLDNFDKSERLDVDKIRDAVYLRAELLIKNRVEKHPVISVHSHQLTKALS